MGKFGWDLPPGCTQRMIYDEVAGAYAVCDVCGQYADNCICPECPECGEAGKLFCYHHEHGHGLELSPEQLASRAAREAHDREENERWDALAQEYEEQKKP